MSMIPRSLRSFVPPIPLISSSLTLSVRVMVALCVWGLASVPISSSPCTMIHSVVSSRSLLSAKLSLPLIVKPCSAGGADIEDDVHVLLNGDNGVFAGHLLVRPGGCIGPALCAGRRRSFLLGLNDGVSAED